RNGAYGAVLPDYAAVILDEAHQIEDVASEYFGLGVSSYQIDNLLRDLSYLKFEDRETQRQFSHLSVRVQRFADAFWVSFREGRGLEGRFALAARGRSENLSENAHWEPDADAQQDVKVNREQDSSAATTLDHALYRVETSLDALKDPPTDADNILRRVRQ